LVINSGSSFVRSENIYTFRYERFAWIPVVITFFIAVGVGGHHLRNPVVFEPATAPVVMSFASAIAGFLLTYVGLSADFSCYMPPDAPRYAGWF